MHKESEKHLKSSWKKTTPNNAPQETNQSQPASNNLNQPKPKTLSKPKPKQPEPQTLKNQPETIKLN